MSCRREKSRTGNAPDRFAPADANSKPSITGCGCGIKGADNIIFWETRAETNGWRNKGATAAARARVELEVSQGAPRAPRARLRDGGAPGRRARPARRGPGGHGAAPFRAQGASARPRIPRCADHRLG